ncbi:hypothetical protein CN275_00310 [Bacillus anthracis]|nr:hypothetical protein CN275_00310 [Bacillus anthracis]
MKEFSVLVRWINGEYDEYFASLSRNDATVEDVEFLIENSKHHFIKIGDDLVNLNNVLSINVSEIGN